ncbi:LamG domain-containing protein, partial [Patescibacteria group bacterium]|nr:LamG domain-containing protein [Patescibacteria group bacterium]
IIQPGGIFNMTPGSEVKFLVDYDSKQIIFTSGTTQGYNIPSEGNSCVFDYMRDLPVIKMGQNHDSVEKYKKRVKIVVDKNIKDADTAELVMLSTLEQYSDPLKQGTLVLKDIYNLTPGENCNVNIPIYGINNNEYQMTEVDYNLSQDNLLRGTIMTVKLNKNLPDITDNLKDILLQLKKIQGGDISNADLITRFQLITGSFGIRQSGCSIYTIPINDSFIAGHSQNSVLGVVNPSTVGSLISGVSWVSGIMGTGYDKACSFNGTNGQIKINNTGIWSNGSYTISLWTYPYVMTTAAGIGRRFYSECNSTLTPPLFSIEQTASIIGSNVEVVIRNDNNDVYVSTISNSDIKINNWYNIILTENAGSINLYINGNLDKTINYTHSGTLTTDRIGIGAVVRNSPVGFASGIIDDVRIYNYALSGTEIGSLYSKVNYPLNGLVAWYKFDEGMGSFAYNSVGSGNTSGNYIQPFLGDRRGSSELVYSGGYF